MYQAARDVRTTVEIWVGGFAVVGRAAARGFVSRPASTGYNGGIRLLRFDLVPTVEEVTDGPDRDGEAGDERSGNATAAADVVVGAAAASGTGAGAEVVAADAERNKIQAELERTVLRSPENVNEAVVLCWHAETSMKGVEEQLTMWTMTGKKTRELAVVPE